MPEDFELTESTGAVAPRAAPEPGDNKQSPTSLDLHRASERERILEALSSSNWNRVRAAELVGMPRRTFYRRLKEYGIQ
jgi:transcriptional regulator of acetoin/glycerol metabolism